MRTLEKIISAKHDQTMLEIRLYNNLALVQKFPRASLDLNLASTSDYVVSEK